MASELWALFSSPTVNSANSVGFCSFLEISPLAKLKSVSDATILLRDVAGDAAQNAASRVNPSQEQLSQIDSPAADNTWHDVPDLSRDNLRNQAKNVYNKQKPFSSGDVKDAAGNASQAANPSGSRDPADTAMLAGQEQQTGTNQGVDAAGGAQQGISQLREQGSANVPEETKTRAKEFRERSKGYVSGKLPKERREQSIYRLKKMIVEVQGHPDCESGHSRPRFSKCFAHGA